MWLQSLKREFLERVREQDWDDEFVILIYCKAGVHRSVGASAVLREIFSNEGYRVESCHLSGETKFSKRRLCHAKCDACRVGKRASEKKKGALAQCRRKVV